MNNWYVIIIIIIALAGFFYYNPQILTQLKSFGFGITPIGDITNNFTKYENKTVTILGNYGTVLFPLSAGKFLVDEQNYNIRIECEESDRTFNMGEKYKATGIITFDSKCSCQERYVANVTNEEWEEFKLKNPTFSKENVSMWNVNYLFLPSPEEGWFTISTYLGKIKISDCVKSLVFAENYSVRIYNSTNYFDTKTEIIRQGRCEPNSIEKFYYFKCTKPMVKIS